LFKGGAYLEALGSLDTIAFDKTGTITTGKPAVTHVWTEKPHGENLLLEMAASVEHASEHPVAQAIVKEAKSRGLSLSEVREFENHTGLGVHGRVNGTWVGVGREVMFEDHDVALSATVLESARRLREAGQTALIVAGGQEAGVIAVADQPRPNAAKALSTLKEMGLRRIVLLTGDHAEVARAVARSVGADEFRAGLLPDGKVIEIHRLQREGQSLAMVGDGINDAPALAAATVGIAMGGVGTDVALEVADVVLMRDNLEALSFAVWLSRQADRQVRQNIGFALGVIGFLILSSFCGLPLWLGVLGHEGSTLLVVLNGLRLFLIKPKSL
jgi:Cd2+/Zn2+-exporting ATPase